MDPEILLAVAAAALSGTMVWPVAFAAGWAGSSVRHRERAAWWRLVLPLVAGGLMLAFLIGWAVQESDPADERVGIGILVLALFSSGIALRASTRGAQALRLGAYARIPVGTLGIMKPRVVVSPEFTASVSDDVLAAALAHEAAHVRGRDPLRIWLAQLAADLQWPVPGTSRRFSAWLLALEAERDDEAVANGASGEDLAEAILVAARLRCLSRGQACAHAAGAGEGIAWRVRRLLREDIPNGVLRPGSLWGAAGSCLALATVAVWLGICYGDAVLGVLPGIRP